MRIYAATGNAGKLAELVEIFGRYGIGIVSWPEYREPEETATTYAGNALIKARSLHQQLAEQGIRGRVLADDSGLEIAALEGRPGIYSARYGGPDATWAERRASLLREVAESGSKEMGARFVCAIAHVDEDGNEVVTEGVADGELARDEKGELGFSYDPIFYDPAERATFAELATERKNAVSHRAKAIEKLVRALALP